MISVLVSGQSPGLPENFSPPMPVIPAIVGIGGARFVPRASGEFGLPAKRQGLVARPTYNADPPLWGLTMVGVCIPNSGKACYRPPFAFAELQRHFTVCTLKKTSTVFTTFFLCSHRFFSQVPGMPSKRCCNPPRSQGARTCSGRTQSSPSRAGGGESFLACAHECQTRP